MSAARSAGGVSSGIGGGSVAPDDIAAADTASSSAPRAGDVEVGLFAGLPAPEPPPASERQRELEPVREPGDAGPASAGGSGAKQTATRVAGRPQSRQGLSAWLAGAENPAAMMRRMQEDLESVFRAVGIPRLGAALVPPRELEELLTRTPALTRAAQWSPQIEVFERDGNLVVHADLPGVKREDVEVNVDNDVLTIRGQRRQEHRETEGGYRRTERSYGTFFRQIPLPEDVDPRQIAASYEDGVLEVIIPTPEDQPRGRQRIDIR